MNKECQWCGMIKCTHCTCVGYPGCSHLPNEQCANMRYKNRTFCNTCARKKFDYKHVIEPVEQYVNQLKSNEADDFGGQLQASLRTFDDVDKISIRFPSTQLTAVDCFDWNQVPENPIPEYPPFISDLNRQLNGSNHTIFSYTLSDYFDNYQPSYPFPNIENPPEIIREKQYIHVNMQYNITPIFFVIINQSEKLSSIRNYISQHFNGFNIHNYVFISSSGIDILESQEDEMSVENLIVFNDFDDPLLKTTTRRKHIFIKFPENKNKIYSQSNKRYYFDSDIDVEKEFLTAPIEVQERLALCVYSEYNYSCKDKTARPLLIRAAYQNLTRAVNMILLSGGDINVEDSDGNTALHIAARQGNYEVLTILLDKLFAKRPFICGRPNLFKKNSAGLIPIQMCDVSNGCFQILKDTMRRFRKLRSPCLAFSNVTPVSEIRSNIKSGSINDNPLEMLFLHEGTYIYENQESEILSNVISTDSTFLVFILPHSTNVCQPITESVSSLNLLSFNKSASIHGSFSVPKIYNDLSGLRNIVEQDEDKSYKEKLEEIMQKDRSQFNSSGLDNNY